MAFRPVGRLVVPFRCCSNSRLLCSLQSEHLIKSTHYSRPEVFKLDDQSFVPDEKWNLSQAVIHMLERRLLNEKDNPLRLLKQSIIDYVQKNYRKPGSCSPKFTVCDNMSRVVSIWENFDSLLTPVDHVSRRPTDTYYVNETHCLRAHTSAHQYELFKQGLDNFIVIGDVYRRDEINRTHYPAFHQLECVQLFTANELFGTSVNTPSLFEENGKRDEVKQEWHTLNATNFITIQLKSFVEHLCLHLYGKNIQMKWVKTYFPFTHPSFELEVFYDGKWMETLGCGVVEQKILDSAGATDKVGWAFGLGLERLAMILYDIPDIRLFWSQDSGFLSQFAGKSPEHRFKYKPVSVHPQVFFDLSFWLPDGVIPEELTANTYDLIRSVGGLLVEQVNLSDSFTNRKTGKRSQTYRIVYRSNEKALTKEEVRVVHEEIEKQMEKRFSVKVR